MPHDTIQLAAESSEQCMSSIINSKSAATEHCEREGSWEAQVGLEWLPFVSQLLRWCFDCGATMLGRTHISADNHFNLGTIFDLGCRAINWQQTISWARQPAAIIYHGSSAWLVSTERLAMTDIQAWLTFELPAAVKYQGPRSTCLDSMMLLPPPL